MLMILVNNGIFTITGYAEITLKDKESGETIEGFYYTKPFTVKIKQVIKPSSIKLIINGFIH